MQLSVRNASERAITCIARWRHLKFLPSESLVEAIRADTGSEAVDKRERTFVEEVRKDLAQRS